MVRVSRVGLVESIELDLGLVLELGLGLRIRVIGWIFWHRGGTLSFTNQ